MNAADQKISEDPALGKATQILWTGGWDSTFRLLQLLIIHNMKVQPWYIMDPDRFSLSYELRAMQYIRNTFSNTFPAFKDHLLPTQYIELNSIPLNEDILNSINRIREKNPLGQQYNWLSSFAFFYTLRDLEISLEKGGDGIFNFLRQKFTYINEDGVTFFKVDPKYEGSDEYNVFQYFRFPLMEISKLDMKGISKEHGFYHILNTSWFCHHPRSNGTPCGVCIPCAGVVHAGMRHRLPASSQWRYVFRDYMNRDNFKKKYPGWHAIGRKVKHRIKGNKKKVPE